MDTSRCLGVYATFVNVLQELCGNAWFLVSLLVCLARLLSRAKYMPARV